MYSEPTFDDLQAEFDDLDDPMGDVGPMLVAALREGRTDFWHRAWAKEVMWECEDQRVVEQLLDMAATGGAFDAGMSAGILRDSALEGTALPRWMSAVAPVIHKDDAARLIWFAERVVPHAIEDCALDEDLRADLTEVIRDWILLVLSHPVPDAKVRAYVAFRDCAWRDLLDDERIDGPLDTLREAAGFPAEDDEDADEDNETEAEAGRPNEADWARAQRGRDIVSFLMCDFGILKCPMEIYNFALRRAQEVLLANRDADPERVAHEAMLAAYVERGTIPPMPRAGRGKTDAKGGFTVSDAALAIQQFWSATDEWTVPKPWGWWDGRPIEDNVWEREVYFAHAAGVVQHHHARISRDTGEGWTWVIEGMDTGPQPVASAYEAMCAVSEVLIGLEAAADGGKERR